MNYGYFPLVCWGVGSNVHFSRILESGAGRETDEYLGISIRVMQTLVLSGSGRHFDGKRAGKVHCFPSQELLVENNPHQRWGG